MSLTPTSTAEHPNGRSGAGTPTLIAAKPALALIERWEIELMVLRHRSPGSDAVTTLADCVEELRRAIETGRDVRVQLTVAEAHALSGMPLSTLRWLCKHKPDTIGAAKREGVWYIDRARFEHYLRPYAARSVDLQLR
jgi:hypothetical protein